MPDLTEDEVQRTRHPHTTEPDLNAEVRMFLTKLFQRKYRDVLDEVLKDHLALLLSASMAKTIHAIECELKRKQGEGDRHP